jgi:hypothetical protein
MVCSKYVRRVLLGGLLLALWAVPAISAQTVESWSEPAMLSEEPWFGWFPDFAVDNLGNVHLFWEAADFSRWRLGLENTILYPFGLMHRVWDGREWSEQNDVIAYLGTEGIIFRLATAADADGYVYMTYSRDGVNFTRALSENSMSATAWSAPYNMSDGIYMSDIAVDSKHNIHIVYEETVMEPLDESQLSSETPLRSATLVHAEIYYRRSEDGGRTWTIPVNLSNTLDGTARVRLDLDSQETLYVSWEVGWSRWGSSKVEPRHGVLVASSDGGRSWNELATFAEPEATNAQFATASDGQGGVLAIWRARTTDDIYYAWSTDHGGTWSAVSTIPGIYARRWDNPFDVYDIGVDSAGTMHVVLVGRKSVERNTRGEWEEPALYHLAWDGVSWSKPVLIRRCDEGWRPEYPRIAISRGNQLHVTWFEYDYTDRFYIATSRIWYSSYQSTAPELALLPTPTPTPTPIPTPSPVAESTATATPIPRLELTPFPQGLAESVFTDTDEVLLVTKSLLPVGLLIGAVFVGRVMLRRS